MSRLWRSTAFTVPAALLVGLAMVLAGCGGGASEEEAAPEAAAAAPAPAVPEEPKPEVAHPPAPPREETGHEAADALLPESG